MMISSMTVSLHAPSAWRYAAFLAPKSAMHLTTMQDVRMTVSTVRSQSIARVVLPGARPGRQLVAAAFFAKEGDLQHAPSASRMSPNSCSATASSSAAARSCASEMPNLGAVLMLCTSSSDSAIAVFSCGGPTHAHPCQVSRLGLT